MGEVWFGYDKRLDRPVAIKFIRVDRLSGGAPDSELTKRFVRESRTTARLEHPGVPAVYDCGTEGDNLYLVMQLVKGSPVSYLLDEVEQVPIGWAAAIAAQVCSVLAVAHAESLVHRDLKPANLMLCQDGTVKVLDFGVAAALSPTATRLTATGIVVGTAEYMAPEQAMSGTASPQTDLYSLGVILRELLTGTNQFAGETPLASMRRHVDDAPRPLRALRADVPEELERLVLWLLAKNPSQRPPNAVVAYERLLPFCRDLPPLPGFVEGDASHPVLMYAAVVGRIATSREKTPLEEVTQLTATAPASSSVPQRRPQEKMARARKDIGALKAESRFKQAAEVLSDAVEAAVHSLGPEHEEALQLRVELADVLFLGGDYRRAASEFERLVADLMQRKGPDDDHVLRLRLMEANCHAALGDTALALTQLRLLLEDEERFGVDEEHLLELRRRIGLLELGSGDRTRASRTLRDLLPDLERRYGSRHPNVGKVREILGELSDPK
ncbi:protein kinase [Nonomuraea sp. NPDC049486]|uniref:serine/threonine-protein kinase n=1 Tax=Nonomuraea sp. NPDC049486 TaxID=3155773 RepID=UPI0034284DC8